MSLFGRLLTGFLLAVGATLLAQYAFLAADPNGRLAPRLLLAGGDLVRSQGVSALEEWNRAGASAARERLRPIEETGLDAWLLRGRTVVGRRPIPEGALSAGRRTLATGRSERAFGLWTQPLAGGAALVVAVPQAPWGAQIARLGLLLFVPALVCLGLARWLARPVERLRDAAAGLGRGELGTRVGQVGGYREARELGQAFDAMADHVQRLIESQRRLLADFSHEIRSPLARIRLASEMIERGDVEKNRRRIERDVARLDDLVEAVATIVRADHVPLVRERLELRPLVEAIVDAVAFEAERRRVRIVSRLEEVTLEADRRGFHSAVENLLRNAVLHSADGAAVEIVLLARPARVVVSDRGPGVPEADLDRIFEPFFRVEAARDRPSGGTGLGLAIVRRASRLHGGEASAAIREGGGLTVQASFEGGPLPFVTQNVR